MTEAQIKKLVGGMLDRWRADEARLAELFGPYDGNDFSEGAEMQRNIGSAIAAAGSYVRKNAADSQGTQNK